MDSYMQPLRTELSKDEQEAMDAISDISRKIQNLNGRELITNQGELAKAVHTMQFFVLQSACARLGLFGVSNAWRAP